MNDTHYSDVLFLGYDVDPETGFITMDNTTHATVTLNYDNGKTSYNNTCYFVLPTNRVQQSGYNIYKADSVYYGVKGITNLYIYYENAKLYKAGYTESAGELVQANVSSTTISYPSNAKHTDNYWYTMQSKVDHAKGNNLLGTVTSKVETSYPENGYLSGYWYVRTA